jgi:hypothetical protein
MTVKLFDGREFEVTKQQAELIGRLKGNGERVIDINGSLIDPKAIASVTDSAGSTPPKWDLLKAPSDIELNDEQQLKCDAQKAYIRHCLRAQGGYKLLADKVNREAFINDYISSRTEKDETN